MNTINLSSIATGCPNIILGSIINTYITPAISVFGLVLNFLSAVVFIQISKKNKIFINMVKYIFIKSIVDGIIMVITIFSPFYYCPSCEKTRSYASVFWLIYFHIYAEKALQLCSSIMEVMATFECCIQISRKLKFCYPKYISLIKVPLIHVFAFIYCSHHHFDYKILPLNPPSQTIYYRYSYTEFYYSDIGYVLRYGETVLMRILTFSLLIILNSFIFLTFKKTAKRKMKLNQRIDQNNALKHAFDAEKRNQIMIILSELNFIVGQFGTFLVNFRTPELEGVFICLYHVFYMIYLMSLILNFFLYYFFNKNFRIQVSKYLKFFTFNYREDVYNNGSIDTFQSTQ